MAYPLLSPRASLAMVGFRGDESLVTPMPVGAAPIGAGVGEVGSSLSLPRLTAKPLTASAVGSTTQRVVPSGERRASSGVAAAFTDVLLRSVSEPPLAME